VLILALDTTTRGGSVAVSDDDRTLAIVIGDPSRTHGERLPGEMQEALSEAGVSVSELGLLVVASGPGAFTGLRIGLAAIQGLSLAIGLPVVGVSALDALALAAAPVPTGSDLTTLLVWMDAQRGEVFTGRYTRSTESGGDAWTPAGDPTVGPPAAGLAGEATGPSSRVAFAGDGAGKYRDLIAAWSAGATIVEPPPALAPALTAIGRRRAAAGQAGPPHALQPLYVRRPDVELERLKRLSS
jgi:tRNA threonylcarbamoyladenosine biosynthesis protein TsaB